MRKRRYTRFLRLIAQDGRILAAEPKADVLIDEAVDQITARLRREADQSEARRRLIIEQWLSDISGARQ
jgi:hypothetical protein